MRCQTKGSCFYYIFASVYTIKENLLSAALLSLTRPLHEEAFFSSLRNISSKIIISQDVVVIAMQKKQHKFFAISDGKDRTDLSNDITRRKLIYGHRAREDCEKINFFNRRKHCCVVIRFTIHPRRSKRSWK